MTEICGKHPETGEIWEVLNKMCEFRSKALVRLLLLTAGAFQHFQKQKCFLSLTGTAPLFFLGLALELPLLPLVFVRTGSTQRSQQLPDLSKVCISTFTTQGPPDA